MPRFIALLRGVNVGKGNRVSMAEWKTLLEANGFEAVQTLLNSGNAVFSHSGSSSPQHAAVIGTLLERQLGVSVSVVVKSAAELSAIVSANLFPVPEEEYSRFLLVFSQKTEPLLALSSLMQAAALPERFFVTEHAGYLHCPSGILQSKVAQALLGRGGQSLTTRNLATVLKLANLVNTKAG